MHSSTPHSPQQLIDHLFRHQSGKMVAVLSRIFGIHNLSMVEDVVQEAFLKASQVWPLHALPDNPGGWLMRAARNSAIDIIRREKHFQQYSKQLQQETEITIEHFFLDDEIEDSQLQLIFACCHPSLKEEDQLALTLNIVSGFGASEIAKALVSSEAGIQKRITRAKHFLRENKVQLEIPLGMDLLTRLETVYTVLYLLFNEGYNATRGEAIIKRDCCAEAMRLCLLLCQHKISSQPSGYALLSLMCFQASRFESRMNETNDIILLQNQDRDLWNHSLIAKGYEYLTMSSTGETLSIYHIESAIAAEHCIATNFAATNWVRMLELYDLLLTQKNTATVILNRAIVLSRLHRTTEAIQSIFSINQIHQILETQYIYNAVLGDLYQLSGELQTAAIYFKKGCLLTGSEAEKRLLKEKIKLMNAGE